MIETNNPKEDAFDFYGLKKKQDGDSSGFASDISEKQDGDNGNAKNDMENDEIFEVDSPLDVCYKDPNKEDESGLNFKVSTSKDLNQCHYNILS